MAVIMLNFSVQFGYAVFKFYLKTIGKKTNLHRHLEYSNLNYQVFSGLFIRPHIKFGLGLTFSGLDLNSWPVYNSEYPSPSQKISKMTPRTDQYPYSLLYIPFKILN